MRVVGAFLILSLFGCGDDKADVQTSHDNSGSLCIRSTANGPIVVRAVAAACLSSSCSKVDQATCNIAVDGAHITVSSTFRVREPGGNTLCTSDCQSISAECTSQVSLPAGEFVVQYGTATGTLIVPAAKTLLFSDNGFANQVCQ